MICFDIIIIFIVNTTQLVELIIIIFIDVDQIINIVT